MDLLIRKIRKSDISEINRIYNESIELGIATAHIEALPIAYHYEWLHEHALQGNSIFIAEFQKNVVGWNALSNYRKGRQGLLSVRETSYYVDKQYWNCGIASILMKHIIEEARSMGIKTLVTFIMDANIKSVKLMDKFGFELWGRLPGILEMDTGSYDHLIFGKKIV